MSDHDEIERIRRIRDRQLAARDPRAEVRRVQKKMASRYTKKRITLLDVLENIPAKWWGMIIGALVGFALALVLDKVLHVRIPNAEGFWVEYMWYTLVFFGIAMGRGLAMAMDWSDEDYDKMVLHK